jgi:type I restriction enzyme S subunit
MCQLISGQHIDAKDYNTESRGIGYLTGPSDFGPVNPIISKWTEHPKVKAKNGDILVTVKGSGVGKINLLDQEEVVISRQLMAVRVTGADPGYIHAFLSSTFEHFQGLSTGAAIPGISREQVLGLEIATPSLHEQQRIVALLDEAFDGITTAKANAEQNLKNARELFESARETALLPKEGWDQHPLSNLCDIKHGFMIKSEYFRTVGDYVLLTPGNFFEAGGYRDRGEKQKYYDGPLPNGFILSEGDLLVAMTEQAAGLLGSPILVPSSGTFLHNQRLGLVVGRPSVSWTNEFFFHVFNLAAVRKEIHASASGVKVRHTSPSKIGDARVAFPRSVVEQRQIVAKLDELAEETQRLESIYQQKLAALDELKKSLLHKAFNGEL